MLLSQLARPAFSPSIPSSSSSTAIVRSVSRVLDVTCATNGTYISVRCATHQAQGRANGAKDGPGKRLGAKKSGGEYVVPGNIIFRQRGTHWFPGENCAFGRDHCVFATQPGWVRYYRDQLKHAKRQYIGVALEKNDRLPYPHNAPRRRKLGMVAVRVEPKAVEPVAAVVGEAGNMGSLQKKKKGQVLTELQMQRTDFSNRESNWYIGRSADRANVPVKNPFVPKRHRYRRVMKRRLSVKANKWNRKIMVERRGLKREANGVAKGNAQRQPSLGKRGSGDAENTGKVQNKTIEA